MTRVLIGINVAIFIFESFLSAGDRTFFREEFGLSLEGLQEGLWWQFLTYAFLHGGIIHLLVNMIGLWFAGRMVESLIGPGRLLVLYIFAAVVGGIFQMVLGGNDVLLLGASGSVCGIIIAFTTMLPEEELFVLLFFVIPLRLRAKFLGWGLIGITVLFLIFHLEAWVGHAAHLGGCVAGFLFARISGYAKPSRIERRLLRIVTIGRYGG